MSVFVHAQGIKTVNAGGRGAKNGTIPSTQFLNDPLAEIIMKRRPPGHHCWSTQYILGHEFTVWVVWAPSVENFFNFAKGILGLQTNCI